MPSNFCSKFPCLFSIGLLAILLILSGNLIEATSGGVIVDLIHRDSPVSPLYNPHLTHFQRQKNAFRRSLARVNQFASIGVFPSGGEYVMKVSYGTPAFETLAIIDTASDFTWTQCQKCINCFQGKNPPFDPRNSSTFKLVGCNTQTCKEVTGANNCSSSNSCGYRSDYGDRSYSQGEIAIDTITLGGIAFPSFPFGCGHDSGGLRSHGASGLVGLGYSNTSLVTHTSYSTGWRFSYCLGPSTESSKPGKINLGAVISGDGVVSTPLLLGKYYQVTLEAVSVDEKRFEFPKNFPSNKNIIIDSGTSYTFLPKELYQGIATTVKERINSTKTVPGPNKFLSLCYSSLDDLKIPNITFHFKGADLKLVNPINTFVATSDSAFCLAFAPSVGSNLFGNIQQSNFWVGYDLQNSTVSFKPADCKAT